MATSIESAPATSRRHDVDWVRVLALLLLIIYHSIVAFQPWARRLSFIASADTLTELWIPVCAINIWRIPILFMVSGMGVYFAMRRRNWKQLLKDRTVRILIPYIFGFLGIGPLVLVIYYLYYFDIVHYLPSPVHLWFLGNIYVYVLLFFPLVIYLKNRPKNILLKLLTKLCGYRFGIYLFAVPIMIEAWALNPNPFSFYATTPHGAILGALCFIFGFVFVSLGSPFWKAAQRNRWISLCLAIALYLIRLLVYRLMGEPNILIAFESMCWMLAIFGFASLRLNKPSRILTYLNKSVYPVYIIHFPVQYAISYYLFKTGIPAILKLTLLIIGTLGISLAVYHFALRHLKAVRLLFGIHVVSNKIAQNSRP